MNAEQYEVRIAKLPRGGDAQETRRHRRETMPLEIRCQFGRIQQDVREDRNPDSIEERKRKLRQVTQANSPLHRDCSFSQLVNDLAVYHNQRRKRTRGQDRAGAPLQIGLNGVGRAIPRSEAGAGATLGEEGGK